MDIRITIEGPTEKIVLAYSIEYYGFLSSESLGITIKTLIDQIRFKEKKN